MSSLTSLTEYVKSSVESKIVIVTGSNAGVGREAARQLYNAGATVIMACRSTARSQPVADLIIKENPNSKGKIEVMELDLSDLNSVRHFVKRFTIAYSQLNILINNAGMSREPAATYEGPWFTSQGLEIAFGTNYIGHFYLTHLLLDILIKSQPSRIVMSSSLLHWFAPLEFKKYCTVPPDQSAETMRKKYAKGYSVSKLACMIYGFELQRRIKEKYPEVDLRVLSVDPGLTMSDLWRGYGTTCGGRFMVRYIKTIALTSHQGSRTTLEAATRPDIEGGKYLIPIRFNTYRASLGFTLYYIYTEYAKYAFGCTVEEPSDVSKDPKVAKELWDMSTEFLNSNGFNISEL